MAEHAEKDSQRKRLPPETKQTAPVKGLWSQVFMALFLALVALLIGATLGGLISA
jgi:hypothetical protein